MDIEAAYRTLQSVIEDQRKEIERLTREREVFQDELAKMTKAWDQLARERDELRDSVLLAGTVRDKAMAERDRLAKRVEELERELAAKNS